MKERAKATFTMMTKRTFHIILLLWLLIAVLFAAFPQLDIQISALFYKGGWPLALSPFAKLMRTLGMALPVSVAVLALINLYTQHVARPVSYFLLSSGLIAPLLIVNLLLKDHWHRARPVQILEFGGKFDFTPWYERGTQCVKNCSFVSGDGAGVFWLLGAAFLLPEALRKVALGLTLVFALYIAFLRLSFGGHFFSDIAFAAIITYITQYLLYKRFFPKTPSN
jgi:lipid A 4'-phosphatase